MKCEIVTGNMPQLWEDLLSQLHEKEYPSESIRHYREAMGRVDRYMRENQILEYQVVYDGTVSTNSLDGIWEAFCRKPLGSDGQPLAISDLIELYDDSGSEFYYVDRTSIVPVQLEAPEQESGMTMTL